MQEERWGFTFENYKCGFYHSLVYSKQGVTLIKSIVYGNVARYFGKKREEDGHTHSWMCYLRPFKNEVLCTRLLFVLLILMWVELENWPA